MALTEHLLNAGRRAQTSKRAGKSPHNWVGKKKKEKKSERKEAGWDLCPWEGAVKEESSHLREVPSVVGRSARTEGKLQSLRGLCSNRFAEGNAERDLHR